MPHRCRSLLSDWLAGPPAVWACGGSALERGRETKGEGGICVKKVDSAASFFLLTHDVQDVGVLEAPMLVLYHTRVVAFVGWHDRLHDQCPHVVSDLKCNGKVEIRLTGVNWSICLPYRPLTLKPPILWSFLNSLPFLYQRRLGTGCPTAWQRNFTVLLAGTAWSCFSIFSGMTQRGADAGEQRK